MPTSTLNSGLLSSPGWTVRSLPPKITRPLLWWPINKALSYLHFSCCIQYALDIFIWIPNMFTHRQSMGLDLDESHKLSTTQHTDGEREQYRTCIHLLLLRAPQVSARPTADYIDWFCQGLTLNEQNHGVFIPLNVSVCSYSVDEPHPYRCT